MASAAKSVLMSQARAGDGDAFRELSEPHRRELQVPCYRMLGSFQDAEDVLQETLLAAWQDLGGFDGRASPARCRLGRRGCGGVEVRQRIGVGRISMRWSLC